MVDDPDHPVKKSMELGPRDRLSQAFIQERDKGKMIDGPYGRVSHLDVRHLGEKKIDKKIPFVRELARNYAGIDPVHEPIPVRPVVHYCMGGVDTDIDTATPMPGLYAAGEAACVSINGANRLGSNSLTELLVFGARAGRNAATHATESGDLDLASIEKQAEAEQKRLRDEFLTRDGGTERVSTLRSEMHETMEEGAGIYRTGAGLRESREKIAELRERFGNVRIDDRTNSFNTDLTAALELDFMLDVAGTLIASALNRTESRGSHQRSDHPERDDEKFLCHSLAYRTDDAPRIESRDVVITRWPPAERVYGKTDE